MYFSGSHAVGSPERLLFGVRRDVGEKPLVDLRGLQGDPLSVPPFGEADPCGPHSRGDEDGVAGLHRVPFVMACWRCDRGARAFSSPTFSAARSRACMRRARFWTRCPAACGVPAGARVEPPCGFVERRPRADASTRFRGEAEARGAQVVGDDPAIVGEVLDHAEGGVDGREVGAVQVPGEDGLDVRQDLGLVGNIGGHSSHSVTSFAEDPELTLRGQASHLPGE